MSLITTTKSLEDFCARQAGVEFVTVDTEFMREKSYWPQLCLVQVAGPGEAVAIDPLAEGLDLRPLFDLMADTSILKVFHAARQDVEIFHHQAGQVPRPLFDTQVAAMVCGFGDSVSYETLVAKVAGVRVDKSSRFTDWSLRPLTERQLAYALSDVVHLRPVYDRLRKRLVKSGRIDWLGQEMSILTSPATYVIDPANAWLRFKLRTAKPRQLAILREVAAWRERDAQDRDLPRGRILRDECVLEIAAHAPTTVDELAKVRGLGRHLAEGRQGVDLLAAVVRGVSLPDSQCPREDNAAEIPPGMTPIVDLLRVLLKMKCEDHHVASKLIATGSDLEAIAADDNAKVPALDGWRREVFGKDALALKHGDVALAISENRLKLVPLEPVKSG
ncbi:MAG: ribonuclease D [Rhodospirillaceae bacterium]